MNSCAVLGEAAQGLAHSRALLSGKLRKEKRIVLERPLGTFLPSRGGKLRPGEIEGLAQGCTLEVEPGGQGHALTPTRLSLQTSQGRTVDTS